MQQTSLVDGRIEESEQALQTLVFAPLRWLDRANLMCNIRSGIANIAVHLAHDANVLVAVQQRVLLVAAGHAWPRWRTVRSLVGFETSI